MISLRRPRDGAPGRAQSLVAAIVAVAYSLGSFALVLSLQSPAAFDVNDVLHVRDQAERLVFVPARETPTDPTRAADEVQAVRPTRTTDIESVQRAVAETTSVQPMRVDVAPAPGTAPPASTSGASRLARPGQPASAWFTAPWYRDPFRPLPPLSAAARESTVKALGDGVPEAAARRVATQEEIDAAAKEAMLKIRQSGRALLVPPDNTGGLIATSFPIPVLSRGAAKRARDRGMLDSTRARVDRLQRRADSVKAVREDSIERGLAGVPANPLQDRL